MTKDILNLEAVAAIMGFAIIVPNIIATGNDAPNGAHYIKNLIQNNMIREE